MNNYYNPVRTVQGPGCLKCLPQILQDMKLTHGRVLILGWDTKVFEYDVFSQLHSSNQSFHIQKAVFQESNPTVKHLFKIYKETKDFFPEAVVAIGGGSIMDVGKSLCCLYGKEISSEQALREFIQNKEIGSPKTKWVGIPTTSGTGSEVTCWATIWDPEKEAKRSMENPENYAYAALVDPEMTEGMPLKLAVSSALDAVAHGVESYWAKGTNAVSKALALWAVNRIMSNMEALLSGKAEGRDAMAQGSMMAGLAFSNTKTTACHSISYPLTMHYKIPHGAAVSMLLAPVFQMNASGTDGMPELLKALGVKDGEDLKERISSFLIRSGQPASLKGWGVKEEELPGLAELGMTKGRADNNPVEITAETINIILKSIY